LPGFSATSFIEFLLPAADYNLFDTTFMGQASQLVRTLNRFGTKSARLRHGLNPHSRGISTEQFVFGPESTWNQIEC